MGKPLVVIIRHLPSLSAPTGAIQIPTVSFSLENLNTTALAQFGEFLQTGLPQAVERGGGVGQNGRQFFNKVMKKCLLY